MKVPADRIIVMNGSKRSVLSIALMAIGAAAMYNWILSPHVGYLRAVQRYQPIVDQVARETGVIGKTLDTKRQRLRSMQRELAGIHESLFTDAEAKAFLNSLQPFVERTGCVVAAANFPSGSDGQTEKSREPKERPPATAFRAGLTVAGQYDQIITLFERLQTNPKKIWVDSCDLKLSDLRSGRLECRVSLILYALSEKEGPVDE